MTILSLFVQSLFNTKMSLGISSKGGYASGMTAPEREAVLLLQARLPFVGQGNPISMIRDTLKGMMV